MQHHISFYLVLSFCALFLVHQAEAASRHKKRDQDDALKQSGDMPCECGVFMSGQLNSTKPAHSVPTGPPVISYETESPMLPCGSSGIKQCINKCIDVVAKHIGKAGPLICSASERDVRRERAYLFLRNCSPKWVPTSFSAGKEFCCMDNEVIPCSKLDA